MKYLALLVITLAACTHVDAQKGTFFTMGDSHKFKADWRNGQMTHMEWDDNLHTPAAKAHWHGILTLGAEAAGVATGGAIPGGAAVVPAVAAFVNRPTNRATPTPKP